MRATANPPSLAGIADAVWDELTSTHVIGGSFGEDFTDIHTYLAVISGDYARRTAYTYGPTALGAGATYVPVAGTVITLAAMDGIANDKFEIVHGTTVVANSGDINVEGWVKGYLGFIYCDGTDIGIKNNDGAGHDLVIEGFTI